LFSYTACSAYAPVDGQSSSVALKYRKPPVYLTGGETVVTEIEGLGLLQNRIVRDGPSSGAT